MGEEIAWRILCVFQTGNTTRWWPEKLGLSPASQTCCFLCSSSFQALPVPHRFSQLHWWYVNPSLKNICNQLQCDMLPIFFCFSNSSRSEEMVNFQPFLLWQYLKRNSQKKNEVFSVLMACFLPDFKDARFLFSAWKQLLEQRGWNN